MEFYDVIKQRRSVRAYTEQEIEKDKMQRIWEAVRLAPTACNLQPFCFLLVQAPASKDVVASVYPQPWLKKVPLMIIALGNREKAWKRRDGSSAHVIDVSIAMEHLVLAAAAEGLGTCWICAFDQKELHSRMGIDPEWDVIAITPLGYPAETPNMPKRKDTHELFAVI